MSATATRRDPGTRANFSAWYWPKWPTPITAVRNGSIMFLLFFPSMPRPDRGKGCNLTLTHRCGPVQANLGRRPPGGYKISRIDRKTRKGATMSQARTTAPRSGAAQASRFLHTMIRVRDLDESIDFYTRLLGMKLLRRKDYPSGEFTLAFVGYGDESDGAVIELTHNWGRTEAYELGTGFGHLAIGVPDIYAACEKLGREGVKIPRPPGPMKHGGSVIAFIEDPDGYKIELIQE